MSTLDGWYERYCTAYHPSQDVALYTVPRRGEQEPQCLGWYMWMPREWLHIQIDLYTMRRVWGWEVDEMREFVSMFDKEEYLS